MIDRPLTRLQLEKNNGESSEEKTQMKPSIDKGEMYKSRLNEFIQKSRFPLPEYQTRMEGVPSAPRFRSRVLVNGKSYESQNFFLTRKASEQDAARLALEQLTGLLSDEGYSIIQDLTRCKSILNEYATKLKLKPPEYTTVPGGGVDTFISLLVFEGKFYEGEAGPSKKRAEQLAAHAAIRSIASASELLCQIINSKANVASQLKGSGFEPSNLPLSATPDASFAPSTKDIDISPSTANLENMYTVDNSSGENKRKWETDVTETGTEVKKRQGHDQ